MALAFAADTTPDLVDDYRPSAAAPKRFLLVLVAALVVLLGALSAIAWTTGRAPPEIVLPWADYDGPLPVQAVVPTTPVEPSDYAVVTLFGDEAILAAGDMLLRVKVGSTAPGLGRILAITAEGAGGTVVAQNARLRVG